MRRLILVGVVLLGLGSAEAQQLPPEPKLTLQVTTDEAMMIVAALKSIGCQNVTQFVICQKVVELLGELRKQLEAQGR